MLINLFIVKFQQTKERHCNENAMKTAIIFRQRGLVPIINNQNNASNLNYSSDAAFVAIQRNQKVKREHFIVIHSQI